MDEKGYTWTRLDGSMNTRERNAVIAQFQDSSPDSPRVLLLSLRAGISFLLQFMIYQSILHSGTVLGELKYRLLGHKPNFHIKIAGGVGLNLTAARKLILLDPAWNPATENQCFDRIHRLGQTEDVEIIKFVMKDR